MQKLVIKFNKTVKPMVGMRYFLEFANAHFIPKNTSYQPRLTWALYVMRPNPMLKEFIEIETALGITLPTFYKNALENYPFSPLDDLDFVEDNLVKDFEWIVETNKNLRTEGFFGSHWPNQFLAIGHDGFGDFLFLNLSEEGENIYITNHEEEFDCSNISDFELAASMKEYIDLCLEEQQDVVKNV